MRNAPATHKSPKLISVVTPTLNGAMTIAEQLGALAAQTYEGEWELVVADNGSTDTTLEIVRQWEDKLPRLRIVEVTDAKGVSHAINGGIGSSEGDFIVFCMQDDVVGRGWLSAMAEAAQRCDLVGGSIDNHKLNEPIAISWQPSHPEGELRTALNFLPFVVGANLGIWADVSQRLGGWSEEFTNGGEDVDLCWRAQLASFRFCYAPDAVVHFRYRADLKALWRQFRRYGMADTQLYRRFRDQGVGRSGISGALKSWARAAVEIPMLVGRPERKGKWVRQVAYRWGRIQGSVRNRVLYL